MLVSTEPHLQSLIFLLQKKLNFRTVVWFLESQSERIPYTKSCAHSHYSQFTLNARLQVHNSRVLDPPKGNSMTDTCQELTAHWQSQPSAAAIGMESAQHSNNGQWSYRTTLWFHPGLSNFGHESPCPRPSGNSGYVLLSDNCHNQFGKDISDNIKKVKSC